MNTLGSATVCSHLSHNWYIKDYFWSKQLSSELAQQLVNCRVEIESIRGLPECLMERLLHVARNNGFTGPVIYIHNCSRDDTTQSFDANGVLSSPSKKTQQRFLQAFSRRGLLHVGDAPDSELTPIAQCDIQELLALPRTDAPARPTFEHFKAAFEQYRFEDVIRLGKQLCDCEHSLDNESRALLFHALGLSAHNRQFSNVETNNLSAFSAFLHDCYSRAYALEQNPIRRVALCYRLAVTCGRRQKDFHNAMAWATRMLQYAESLEERFVSAYHAAWARGIRAYISGLNGQTVNAKRDIETAIEILADAYSDIGEDDPLAREYNMTRSVNLANRAFLARIENDDGDFLLWHLKTKELAEVEPLFEPYTEEGPLDFYEARGDLTEALASATRGGALAKRQHFVFRQIVYEIRAIDLMSKLGRHEEAVALLEQLPKTNAFYNATEHLFYALKRAILYWKAGMEQKALQCLDAIQIGGSASALVDCYRLLLGGIHQRLATSTLREIEARLEETFSASMRCEILRLLAWIGDLRRVWDARSYIDRYLSEIERLPTGHERSLTAATWHICLLRHKHYPRDIDALRRAVTLTKVALDRAPHMSDLIGELLELVKAAGSDQSDIFDPEEERTIQWIGRFWSNRVAGSVGLA